MHAIDTSKTHRLYLLLKEQIVAGAWGLGERLPSEPQLAARHGVSRVTVRRALEGLVRDGIIRRSPGAGTFVAKPPAPAPIAADLVDMLAHLAAMGRSSRVRLLGFEYIAPPPHVAEALQLPRGVSVQHALRVRLAAGTPFSYLSTYVPEPIGWNFSRRDLARTPLLALLERSGVIAERAEQTVTATLAGPEAASALDVQVGAALLALTRVVFDEQGNGVEYLSALYRPDMHAIRMELSRAGSGAERYWTAQNRSVHSAATVQRLPPRMHRADTKKSFKSGRIDAA